MKRVLESGEVEISNNISEQSVRKLKMNLRNVDNIGSESSAADNAFMYSVIESCRHNEIDSGKYVSDLLGKLKTARNGENQTGLLPCFCGCNDLKPKKVKLNHEKPFENQWIGEVNAYEWDNTLGSWIKLPEKE